MGAERQDHSWQYNVLVGQQGKSRRVVIPKEEVERLKREHGKSNDPQGFCEVLGETPNISQEDGKQI